MALSSSRRCRSRAESEPRLKLLTSLGIGALTGDEVSVRAGVTLSRRRMGCFFDVCVKGLGIFFFHPQKWYRVREWTFSDSFTQTQTLCSMSYMQGFFQEKQQDKKKKNN